MRSETPGLIKRRGRGSAQYAHRVEQVRAPRRVRGSNPCCEQIARLQAPKLQESRYRSAGPEARFQAAAYAVLARGIAAFLFAFLDRRSAHGELIRFIESLGYEVFEIAEMCGFLDCRNYLCIPPQLKHSFAPHRNAILEGYRPLFP